MSPMPPILSRPSSTAKIAIIFVTVGALLMVNTAIVHTYMANHEPVGGTVTNGSDAKYYWNAAFFFSGMTLFVLGFGLGSIGRSGRKAELPPEVPASTNTSQPAVTAVEEGNAVAATAATPVIPGQAPAVQQPQVMPVAAVAPVAPVAPIAPANNHRR